jgi:hypothetical protein
MFPENFPHSVFLKDISGKFPHSRGKNVLGTLPLPCSFLKSLPYKTKDLAIFKYWLSSFTVVINGNEERKKKKERKKV